MKQQPQQPQHQHHNSNWDS